MGLLEKLKNTFFEEEYVEVEEKEDKPKKKEIKEEKKEPKVEVAKKVEEVEELEDIDDEEMEEETSKDISYSDNDLVNKNSKLTYFDDEDFEPTQTIPVVKKEEPKRVYGESSDTLYSSIKVDDINNYKNTSHKAYGATENKFEPTPIISPIYGILDKNYRKEEVIDKKDRPSSYVSRKNADLDSVRKKAYGIVDKEEEVAKPVVIDEPVVLENESVDETMLFDNTLNDMKPVVDQVTVADAEEYFNDLGLEYNVDYKDRLYENATGRRSEIYEENPSYDEVIINDNSDNDSIEDEDDANNITMDDLMNNKVVEEEPEEAHLEDNLFDLVDSIYEDGEE